MSVNAMLFVILLGLLWYFQRGKGILTLVTLLINLAMLFVMILGINLGFSPIFLTVLTSILISANNLFNINGYNLSTKTAFLSSTSIILLMLLPLWLATSFLHLQGIPLEGLMEMDMYSLHIGISFIDLSVAVLLMTVVGAINDIAISITSSMMEIKEQLPHLSLEEWKKSGLTVGKDVLGPTINTLVFAAIGSQFAILIWVFDLKYSLTQLVNSKLIVTEWVAIIFSGISIALTIPVTIFLITKHLKV
ncbi:YibE/F family protein [Vagococcus sp. JNUCC 83]